MADKLLVFYLGPQLPEKAVMLFCCDAQISIGFEHINSPSYDRSDTFCTNV